MSWLGATLAVAVGAAVMAGNAEPQDIVAAETKASVTVNENTEDAMGNLEFADMLTQMTVITMTDEGGSLRYSFDNGETWLTEEQVKVNSDNLDVTVSANDNMKITYSVKIGSGGEAQ